MFWGLWLFPLALLVYRSRFLPRFLGVWISLAGVAWIVLSLTAILLPQYQDRVYSCSASQNTRSTASKNFSPGMSRPKLLHTHSTLLDRADLMSRRPRDDAYLGFLNIFMSIGNPCDWRNGVLLPGGDGRVRGRVVQVECRMIPCAELGADQERRFRQRASRLKNVEKTYMRKTARLFL
jgi:hypothetical protein